MGLFIPRGSESVMESPSVGDVSLVYYRENVSWWGLMQSPLEEPVRKGRNIDLKRVGGKGNESKSELVASSEIYNHIHN